MHSPFLYEFYQKVVRRKNYVRQPEIESLRSSLLQRKEKIRITDYGAGSRVQANDLRSIASITRTASMPRKKGMFLNRLLEYYKCRTVLELGTSLGIGTAYFSKARTVNSVLTIEGCPNIAQIAEENFDGLNCSNVELRVGRFDKALKGVNQVFDFVYIDGNHQEGATLEYFKFALEHTHEDSFIVFDDINWSDGMKSAWKKIIAQPNVHVSMDFFQFGIVCKRPTQRKQDFTIKF